MRASEFMIDDLVYGKTDNGTVVGKIDSIQKCGESILFLSLIANDGNNYRGKIDGTHCSIEPIPITDSFLVKNGFIMDDRIKIAGDKYYQLKLDKFTITMRDSSNTLGRDWWVHIDNKDCCTIASADVQYVHQLQNLFNIANVEIDIRL